MPKFRMQRQEMGEQYTTYEVVAANKEEASELIFDDKATIVSRRFKQRDSDILSFEEIPEQ